MDLIKILESLEPVFRETGALACRMQKTATHYDKFHSGNSATDIVTEADLAVQEFLLEAMSKTALTDCRLMAEEKGKFTEKFNPAGKYYLAIDPIDNTAIYAKSGKFFSVIISLHDGKNNLYTFDYFPALNLTIKIINGIYSLAGELPNFSLSFEGKKSIVYYAGEPEKNLPKEILEKMKERGLVFHKISAPVEGFGATCLFACQQVAGVYKENFNVYDGLVSLNIAQAKGLENYSGGPNGKLDFSNIKEREVGLYYPGYYLILNKLE